MMRISTCRAFMNGRSDRATPCGTCWRTGGTWRASSGVNDSGAEPQPCAEWTLPLGPFLKLGTFNINGINQRLDSLLRWLKTSQPDVACLQELKAESTRFPLKAIRDAGYGAV